MKTALTLIGLILSGCAAKVNHTSHGGYREFVLVGVLNEGMQSRQFPLTIRKAIQEAGGLRNCPDCYKTGGEDLLWETVGLAKIRRGEVTLDVKREDFGSFGIQPGDVIYISHKMF